MTPRGVIPTSEWGRNAAGHRAAPLGAPCRGATLHTEMAADAYRRLLAQRAAAHRHHPDVYALLTHRLNGAMYLAPGPRPCFHVCDDTGERAGRSQRLKGVTDLLRKHVFSAYRYRRRAGAPSSGVGSATAGRQRGSKVHAQIEVWSNGGAAALEARWGRSSRADGRDRVEPMTRRFIEWAALAGLEPLVAEFMLCDTECNIGSAVDLVMVNARGSLVLIEIKTGHEAFGDHTTRFAAGPLAGLTDSPLNQAYAQLLLYRSILERRYGVRVGYRDSTSGELYSCCFVVHIPYAADLVAHAMPEHVVAAQDALWTYTMERRAAAAAAKKALAAQRKRTKAADIVRRGTARKSQAVGRRQARQAAAASLMGGGGASLQ